MAVNLKGESVRGQNTASLWSMEHSAKGNGLLGYGGKTHHFYVLYRTGSKLYKGTYNNATQNALANAHL